MTLAIAVPFDRQPTVEDVARIRAMAPKGWLVASIPANCNPVPGLDFVVYHLNVTSDPPQRNIDYGNMIFAPLMAEAVKRGTVVLYLHQNVIVQWKDSKTLITMVDRLPNLVFASGRPRTALVPGEGEIITDYPDRFVAFQASQIMDWALPAFTAQEGALCESSMLMMMNRMVAEGLSADSSWTWQMNIYVQDT